MNNHSHLRYAYGNSYLNSRYDFSSGRTICPKFGDIYEFYTRAISFYLQKSKEYSVTDRLNQIYGKGREKARLDPVLQQLQFQALSQGEW